MLHEMLWIVGIYGFSMLTVHVAYYLQHRHLFRDHAETFRLHSRSVSGTYTLHYVLISNQNQHHIEWILRSLLFYGWLKGKPIRITLLDEGSSDDTLKIAERFARQGPVRIVSAGDTHSAFRYRHLTENAIVVKLNRQEDLKKIPLLQ